MTAAEVHPLSSCGFSVIVKTAYLVSLHPVLSTVVTISSQTSFYQSLYWATPHTSISFFHSINTCLKRMPAWDKSLLTGPSHPAWFLWALSPQEAVLFYLRLKSLRLICQLDKPQDIIRHIRIQTFNYCTVNILLNR